MSPGTEYAAGLLYQVILLPLLRLLLCLHQMNQTHLVQHPLHLQLMSLPDESNPLAQLTCLLWLMVNNLPLQFMTDQGIHTLWMGL